MLRFEKEDFGKTERREKAVAFLDSPELLMMYAQSTGDVSISCLFVLTGGDFRAVYSPHVSKWS